VSTRRWSLKVLLLPEGGLVHLIAYRTLQKSSLANGEDRVPYDHFGRDVDHLDLLHFTRSRYTLLGLLEGTAMSTLLPAHTLLRSFRPIRVAGRRFLTSALSSPLKQRGGYADPRTLVQPQQKDLRSALTSFVFFLPFPHFVPLAR
jgi:hypothetical protein